MTQRWVWKLPKPIYEKPFQKDISHVTWITLQTSSTPRYELVLNNQWDRGSGNGIEGVARKRVNLIYGICTVWYLGISYTEMIPNKQKLISGCHSRWRGLLKFNFRFGRISPKVAELNFRGSLLKNFLNMASLRTRSYADRADTCR